MADDNKILIEAILSSNDESLQSSLKAFKSAFDSIQRFSKELAHKMAQDFSWNAILHPEQLKAEIQKIMDASVLAKQASMMTLASGYSGTPTDVHAAVADQSKKDMEISKTRELENEINSLVKSILLEGPASSKAANEVINNTNATIAAYRKLYTEEVVDVKEAANIRKQMSKVVQAQELEKARVIKQALKEEQDAENKSIEAIRKKAQEEERSRKESEKGVSVWSNLRNNIMGAAAAYYLVKNVINDLTRAFSPLYEAVENFNQSVIRVSALLTGFMQARGGAGSIGEQFKQAYNYSEALITKLYEMSTGTLASVDHMMLITEEFMKQGVILDVNNKKQVEGFKNIANAVEVIASGSIQKEIQVRQEARSLLQGQVRMSDQLAKELDQMLNGQLKESLRVWKEEGTVIEHIGGLLSGYAAATDKLKNTWVAVRNELWTTSQLVLKEGFGEAYNDINRKVGEFSSAIRNNRGQIVAAITATWETLKGVYTTLKDIGALLGSILNPLIQIITLGTSSGVLDYLGKVAVFFKYMVEVALPAMIELVTFLIKGIKNAGRDLVLLAPKITANIGIGAKNLFTKKQTSYYALTTPVDQTNDFEAIVERTAQKDKKFTEELTALSLANMTKYSVDEEKQQDMYKTLMKTTPTGPYNKVESSFLETYMASHPEAIKINSVPDTETIKLEVQQLENAVKLSQAKNTIEEKQIDIKKTLGIISNAEAAKQEEKLKLSALDFAIAQQKKIIDVVAQNSTAEEKKQEADKLELLILQKDTKIIQAEADLKIREGNKQDVQNQLNAVSTQVSSIKNKVENEKEYSALIAKEHGLKIALINADISLNTGGQRKAALTKEEFEYAQKLLALSKDKQTVALDIINTELSSIVSKTGQSAQYSKLLDSQYEAQKAMLITNAENLTQDQVRVKLQELAIKHTQDELALQKELTALKITAAEKELEMLKITSLSANEIKDKQIEILNLKIKENELELNNEVKESQKAELEFQKERIERTKDWHNAYKDAMKSVVQATMDEYKNIYDLTTNLASDMQSAFSEFFTDAFGGELKKASDYFTSFAKSLQKTLANFLSQQVTRQFLESFAGLGAKGGSGSIGWGSAVNGLITAPVGGAGDFRSAGAANANTVSNIISRAPSQPSKAPSVTLHVHNNTGEDMEMEQTKSEFNFDEAVITAVINKKNKSPQFRKELGL